MHILRLFILQQVVPLWKVPESFLLLVRSLCPVRGALRAQQAPCGQHPFLQKGPLSPQSRLVESGQGLLQTLTHSEPPRQRAHGSLGVATRRLEQRAWQDWVGAGPHMSPVLVSVTA